jgi:hypothetical protein
MCKTISFEEVKYGQKDSELFSVSAGVAGRAMFARFFSNEDLHVSVGGFCALVNRNSLITSLSLSLSLRVCAGARAEYNHIFSIDKQKWASIYLFLLLGRNFFHKIFKRENYSLIYYIYRGAEFCRLLYYSLSKNIRIQCLFVFGTANKVYGITPQDFGKGEDVIFQWLVFSEQTVDELYKKNVLVISVDVVQQEANVEKSICTPFVNELNVLIKHYNDFFVQHPNRLETKENQNLQNYRMSRIENKKQSSKVKGRK